MILGPGLYQQGKVLFLNEAIRPAKIVDAL